eukprot:gene2406-4673_t
MSKRVVTGQQSPSNNETFYRQAAEREKNFMLGQLRTNSNLLGANPLLRTMYMNPKTLPPTFLRAQTSYASSPSKMDLVDDKGGQFLLSRGPLPSSVPGLYTTMTKSTNFNEMQAKYNELKNQLKEINEKIDSKHKEIALKMNHSSARAQSLRSSTLPKSQAGGAIQGYGFQWRDALKRNQSQTDISSSSSFIHANTVDRRTAGVWGELTKGCDLPQRSLLLRTEPFVPKTKKQNLTVTL